MSFSHLTFKQYFQTQSINSSFMYKVPVSEIKNRQYLIFSIARCGGGTTPSTYYAIYQKEICRKKTW